MSSKTKESGNESEKYPRKTVICQSGPSLDEQGRNYAQLITSPELAAYRVIGIMQPECIADDIDTPTLVSTLCEQAASVKNGDLTHAEAMLINQASSL